MIRRLALCGLVFATVTGFNVRHAQGQGAAALADEIIIISQGQRAKERERDSTHLGVVHGATERPFEKIPGADEARLGEPIPGPRPGPRDVLSAASQRLPTGAADRRQGILPPALAEVPRPQPPLYGALQLPAVEDEGPPNGLTLEQAIAQVIHSNPDLAIKFEELPKAEADVLTAGLWGNPLVLASAGGVPYGSYSPQRPGSNDYNITIVQPFDVNGKIRARTRLANTAKNVLQAQFQDAVRIEIENLHTIWVDVLSARTTVQYLQTSLATSEALLETVQDQVRKGVAPEPDLDTVEIQRETTTIALDEAVTRLRQAKRTLAVLLNTPPAQSDQIEVRGTIHDRAPTPPPVEELVRLALHSRPDMVAYRLGVRSATANVEMQRRERFPDVFALYSPYNFTANNDDPMARSATSWSAGVFVSVPLFNRNQGNIRRAERNVRQTQLEVVSIEQQIAAEVQNAALEYETTRAAVERFDRAVLPLAQRQRDSQFRLYTEGQESLITYFDAQRGYNEVVRQYRDALISHRRSMLRLNTAVGQRILP
ncbi:MAG: TolC family protein [Actinomycetota bacterium]|nr:TolC family protein [Actinomycetota bacterium]